MQIHKEISVAYNLDYSGKGVCKILPHNHGYILMVYNSNGGHCSMVVDKSHLLGLADFIYETIGEKR